MKCFYHEDREAVATCQHCGKTLCKECASKYNPCMCEECVQILQQEAQIQEDHNQKVQNQKYLEALIDTRGEFIKACLIGVVFSVVVGILGESSDRLFVMMFFFVPFGWKLITYLQSFMPITIFGTLWFWAIWLIIKVVLSMIIGIPAFIYQLIKTFFTQKKIKQAQEESNR